MHREPAADRLPYLDICLSRDLFRLLCLWRAWNRARMHKGTVRADMAEGCPEKFDREFARYIWRYPSDVAPRMEKLIDAHGDHARFFRLRSDGEMNEFVERL